MARGRVGGMSTPDARRSHDGSDDHDAGPTETGGEALRPRSGESGPSKDVPSTRRQLLGILGIAVLTAGFARAAGPTLLRTTCGSPHSSGTGYQEDSSCDQLDNDCGKVTSNPSFGGAGGASYNDADCKPSATTATDGKDNDCGKLHSWGLGGQRDDDCGKPQGDGSVATDQDCNIDNGQIPNGGWQDQDCKKIKAVGEPNALHTDSNPGYDDDEDCTYWDSNCTWFDTRARPKRGDDPQCIHLDND